MSKQLIFIFIGGGLGSVLRFLFSIYVNGDQIKWAPTLLVNILGCALLGIFAAMMHKNILDSNVYALLGIGFCGGLTTFSTFSLDFFNLIKAQQLINAVLYVLLTLSLGFLAMYATYSAAKHAL